MSGRREGRFLAIDYVRSFQEKYPEISMASVDEAFHIGIMRVLSAHADELGVDPPDRFVPLHKRRFCARKNAWELTEFGGDLRRSGASFGYKGLINLKPAVDLVLYTNLIWELRPRTIIELGSLQGGSGLWFADQLDALSPEGHVHSFDVFDKCIHPSAVHPRLHFHKADLRDLATIDEAFVRDLPHPWLVVDDAHENWIKMVSFFGRLMVSGDYYVNEDVYGNHEFVQSTSSGIRMSIRLCSKFGFEVDTKYTDAFGYNVTCAPNGWWRKG